jgi:hypothetical protein
VARHPLECVAEGRYIGASSLADWQLAKALGVSDLRGLSRFVASQSYYSLAGRDIVDVLREVAARHEATVAQVALVWVLAQQARRMTHAAGAASRSKRRRRRECPAGHLATARWARAGSGRVRPALPADPKSAQGAVRTWRTPRPA